MGVGYNRRSEPLLARLTKTYGSGRMSTVKPASADVSSGVELAEVVAAIALATDLGLGQPLEHLLRSCLIATRFADRLGASQEDRDATYWVALFMIAGCTAISFEMSQMFGDDIAFRGGLYGSRRRRCTRSATCSAAPGAIAVRLVARARRSG